jgi:uncharacterized protein (TIGR00661 family)
MQTKDTILIAPLNWGLGHATRCVPVIQRFTNQKARVIIAGQGASLQFLNREFPDLESIQLNGFNIKYPQNKNLFLALALQMPAFIFSIIREHLALKKIIRNYSISHVISDNRYGLWNKKTKNILITHQLFIQLPKVLGLLQKPLYFITRLFIEKFDECWIPDFKDMEQSLSGSLSHGKNMPSNIRFVGPLSRFQNYTLPYNFKAPDEKPDLLILISGPEPFRSAFQKELEAKYKQSSKRILMLCGKPENIENPDFFVLKPGITKVSHLNTPHFYFFLKESCAIVSLAGYSTIMDLHVLGKMAHLIPTPGQTEQQYLVNWNQKKMAAH